MKKILIVMLAIMMLFAFSGTAYAAAPSTSNTAWVVSSQATRGFTYIVYAANYFTITSAGKAEMNVSLLCSTSVTGTRVSAYLQKFQNNQWVTLKHYGEESDTNRCYAGAEWYVVSGYLYRHKVYYYAYNGAVTESTVVNHYKSY